MADSHFHYSYHHVPSNGSDMVPSFDVYDDASGPMFIGNDGFHHFNTLSDGTINSAYPPPQAEVVQRGTKRTAHDANLEDNSPTGEMSTEHVAKSSRKPAKPRKMSKASAPAVTEEKDEANLAPPEEVEAAFSSAAKAEAVGFRQGLYPPTRMNFGSTVLDVSLEAEVDDWTTDLSLPGYSTPVSVPLSVEISASSEWDLPNSGRNNSLLIYRRNYMTFKISFALHPYRPGARINLCFPNGERCRVKGFGMLANAVTADETLSIVGMVQNTTKRDKGPTNPLMIGKVSPRHPEIQHDTGMNPVAVPLGLLLPGNMDASDRPSPTHCTYSRVQFTKATQNNGRSNQPQQYFCIRPELYADISTGPGEPEWYRVAKAYSERMIVRGRSPGHYRSQDDKAQKAYIINAIENGDVDRLVPANLQEDHAKKMALEAVSQEPPKRRQTPADRRANKVSQRLQRSHAAVEPVQNEYGDMGATTMAGMMGIGPQYTFHPMGMEGYGAVQDSVATEQMGGMVPPAYPLPDDHFAHGAPLGFEQSSAPRYWSLRRTPMSMPSAMPQSPQGQRDPSAHYHEPGHALKDADLADPQYEESLYRPPFYGHHMC